MKKRFIAILLTVIFLISPHTFTSVVQANSESDQFLLQAETLKALGIFRGSEKGFDLGREPSRIEGLVMFIRLIGREDDALAMMDDWSYFNDVPKWAIGYANLAYYEGITKGIGNQKFGTNDKMSAQQYLTYALRALGYDDAAGEFTWTKAIDKSAEIGMISKEIEAQLLSETFLRDHLALVSLEALKSSLKNQKYSLAELLVAQKDMDEEVAQIEGIISQSDYEWVLNVFVELPQDQYDIAEAQNMMNRISNIPIQYLKKLIEDGVRLRLINNPLTDEPEYEYLKGVVPRGWEATGLTWDDVPGAGGHLIIARIGYSAEGMGHGSYCLELHEVAHLIDYHFFNLYGFSSTDPAFQAICEAEDEVLFPGNDYFEYDEEFFAEAFVMYYFDVASKETLKQNAPKTYQLFADMENK